MSFNFLAAVFLLLGISTHVQALCPPSLVSTGGNSSFTFPQTQVGQNAFSNETCPDGTPLASATCSANTTTFVNLVVVTCSTTAPATTTTTIISPPPTTAPVTTAPAPTTTPPTTAPVTTAPAVPVTTNPGAVAVATSAAALPVVNNTTIGASVTSQAILVASSTASVAATNNSTSAVNVGSSGVVENATNPQVLIDSLISQSSNLTNVNVNVTTIEAVLNVTDRINQLAASSNGTVRTNPLTLVKSIQNFTDNLRLPGNTTNVTIASSTAVIQVIDPKTNRHGKYDNVTYQPTNVTTVVPRVNVTIPGGVLEQARKKSRSIPRVSFILFSTDALFPSKVPTNLVISASVRGYNPPTLDQPIVLDFSNESRHQGSEKCHDNRLKSAVTRTQCSTYGAHRWSPNHCTLVKDSEPPQCNCYQFASFALIVSTKILPSAFEMGIVTYVGCSLGIVALIATIGIYLRFRSHQCSWCRPLWLTGEPVKPQGLRELRERQPSTFLLHICFTLLIVYIIFIFGVGNVSKRTDCYVTTAFLQYFLLANWSWMTANAFNMYKAFIQIIGGLSKRFARNCIFVCYGVPLVVVVIHSCVAVLYVDQNNYRSDDIFFESAYRARHICWLHLSSLNFGFLLPVGILLLINIILCSVVFAKITCKRIKIQSSAQKMPTTRNFMIAVSLLISTGICWLSGYLMLVADDVLYLTIVGWIFTILISLQGVFLFLIHCVRQRDVRMLWWPRKKKAESTTHLVTATKTTRVSTAI